MVLNLFYLLCWVLVTPIIPENLNPESAIYSVDTLGEKDSVLFLTPTKHLQKKPTSRNQTSSFLETQTEHISEQWIENIQEREGSAPSPNLDFEQMLTQAQEDRLENRKYTLCVNTATYQDLENLGVFSPWEIEAILKYRDDYGPLLGPHELNYLRDFRTEIIPQITPLLSFENKATDPNLSNLLKNGKHELCLRYARTLILSKAYKDQTYVGDLNAYAIRYRFRAKDHIQLGLALQKDPGEKGPIDSWNAFVSVHKIGILRDWIIGSYTLQFGYGLHLGGTLFASDADPQMLSRSGNGVRPYASTAETGVFSGSALRLECGKKTECSFFYSYRRLDAGIENGVITSLPTDGYHRSQNELSKKHKTVQKVWGGNVEHRFKNGKVGMVYSYTKLNLPYAPIENLYRLFSQPSSSLLGGSIYGQYLHRKFYTYTEVAWSFNLSSKVFSGALLQGLQWKAHAQFCLSSQFRYYPRSYTSVWAHPPGMSSEPNNEIGLSVQAHYLVAPSWYLNAKMDWAQRDWFSYPSLYPYTAWNVRVRCGFKPSFSDIYFQYLFKENPKPQHSMRLHASYDAPFGLSLRSRVEVKLNPTAYLIYQDIGYRFESIHLRFQFRYALFDAPSYTQRFYVYESSVLYASSFPMYYGRGQRFYLFLQYQPWPFLTLELKYAQTLYDHKRVIGSGNDQIQAFLKPDLIIQLRFKL